ncbi:hypothetical protein ACQCRO_20550 [Ralstonia pseudosolanacearum]|uniref:hypothetical protein n=1 Tax=Ralstonia pseudosolanacearum TaxID=1310165 RepID=UPI003CEBB8BF
MDVFNRTMRHVNAWRAVAERERKLEALGPEHKGLSPEREMRYACDAIASIQTCLQALAAMKRQQEIPPGWEVDGREAELLQLLIVAADIGVCTRHETLNKLADQDAVFRAQRSGTAEAETVSGPDGPRPDTIEAPEPAGATAPSPSEHAAISPLSALEREPGKIQAWLAEFTSCRSALDQIIRRAEVCGASRTVQTALDTMLPNAIYDKLRCCSGMQALHGILAAASANRFVELSRQMALPDLAVRADELLAAWHKENAAMEAAVDALVVHGAPDKPTQRLTPKALDGHQAVIEAYAEGLDRVGLNLCLDAAADIEMDDADGVWRSMMEVVHAISTRLQHNFGYYPQNPPTSDGTATAMFRTMINRATRNVRDPAEPAAAPAVWWFSQLLSRVREQDRFVFDWTTNGTAGGFKLDGTGDHHQSNLCFRYHTHALNPRLGNRFFLASDSYSHLGGWLEGAFMSAINAVAGLVVAANGGNAGALSNAARDVVTGLRPIAP